MLDAIAGEIQQMVLFVRANVRTRISSDRGASAVEYGLLVAAIAAVIVLIVFALGKVIKHVFHKTCTAVGNGAGVTATCGS